MSDIKYRFCAIVTILTNFGITITVDGRNFLPRLKKSFGDNGDLFFTVVEHGFSLDDNLYRLNSGIPKHLLFSQIKKFMWKFPRPWTQHQQIQLYNNCLSIIFISGRKRETQQIICARHWIYPSHLCPSNWFCVASDLWKCLLSYGGLPLFLLILKLKSPN